MCLIALSRSADALLCICANPAAMHDRHTLHCSSPACLAVRCAANYQSDVHVGEHCQACDASLSPCTPVVQCLITGIRINGQQRWSQTPKLNTVSARSLLQKSPTTSPPSTAASSCSTPRCSRMSLLGSPPGTMQHCVLDSYVPPLSTLIGMDTRQPERPPHQVKRVGRPFPWSDLTNSLGVR